MYKKNHEFIIITVNSSRPVITPSTQNTGTVGQLFNLTCSIDISPYPLPDNVEQPTFEWTHDTANEILPSVSVTPSNTTTYSATYSNILQFSPLLESHSGSYRCKVGGNELLQANATLNVTGAHFYNNILL